MLSYKTYGDRKNKALVFLHGFFGSHIDWQEYCTYLSKDYYCIALDLPGHGNSPFDENLSQNPWNYTLNTITQIIRPLELSSFNLVGYSWGGRIAMLLAEKFPSLIKKAIIISAHPGLVSLEEKDMAQKSLEKWCHNLLEKEPIEFFHLWYNQPIFSTLKPEIKNRLIASRSLSNKENFIKMMQVYHINHQKNLWPSLRHWKVPTLFLLGMHDEKYANLAQQLYDLPNIQVSIVQNCSHALHYEEPKMIQQMIFNFFVRGVSYASC